MNFVQVSKTPRGKQIIFLNWFEYKHIFFLKYRMKMIERQEDVCNSLSPQYLGYDTEKKIIIIAIFSLSNNDSPI